MQIAFVKLIMALCGIFTLLFVFGIFSNWRDGSLLFFIFKHIEIFLALILALLIDFILFLHCEKLRTKAAFKQSRILVYLAIPVVFHLWAYFSSSGYQDCDQYTNELNGGMRTFQGEKYNIRLCGMPSANHTDEIRMQVLNQNGDILAVRYFIVRHNDASPKALEYFPDNINYSDYSKNRASKDLILPPTTMDWIKARIPFID